MSEILIDWKLLDGSIVALISFCSGWGYKLWFSYLKEKEDIVNEKVGSEVDSNVKDYEGLKKNVGIEKFANRLLNLTKLKQEVYDGKKAFEKNMIFSAIILIVGGAFYSLLFRQEEVLLKYQTLIFIIVGIALFIFLSNFYNLYKNKKNIENYLKGIPVDEIYKE